MSVVVGLLVLVAILGVVGVAGVSVARRWIDAQREMALAKLALRDAREGRPTGEPDIEELPAYVDRSDPAAVDAWRRARLEIAESWER